VVVALLCAAAFLSGIVLGAVVTIVVIDRRSAKRETSAAALLASYGNRMERILIHMTEVMAATLEEVTELKKTVDVGDINKQLTRIADVATRK
jgi:hypothetical protein